MHKAQDKKDQVQEDVAEGEVVPFPFDDIQKSCHTRFESIDSVNDELFRTLQSTIKEALDMEFIDKKKKKLSSMA